MDKKDVDTIIQLWRQQRETLHKSLAMDIYPTKKPKLIKSPELQLDFLCENLIDYISVGHFEIYEQLLQGSNPLANDKIELIKGIYQNIERTTDHALCFNDKYDCDNKFIAAEESTLPKDLDQLNRSLAIRFVLEEQLVEIVKN